MAGRVVDMCYSFDVNKAAQILKLASHPQRLPLLTILSDGEYNVGELIELTGLRQADLSNYLRQFRDIRLVRTRRDRQFIYYTVAGPRVKALLVAISRLAL